MARPDKVRMPSGMGGLIRYFDEYKSNIEFKPGHIIILVILIIIIELLLLWKGNVLFGLG